MQVIKQFNTFTKYLVIQSFEAKEYTSIIISPLYFSLGYISEHMNPKNKLAPLFEAQLELLEPDMVFCPSLDPSEEKGFTAMINNLINDILKMSTFVKRIDPTKEESYEEQIMSHCDIIEMKDEILGGIEKVSKYFSKNQFILASNDTILMNNFVKH